MRGVTASELQRPVNTPLRNGDAISSKTRPRVTRRIRDARKELTGAIKEWRPDLLAQEGVGPIVAAVVLSAWSHPGRIRSEGAFAMLSGTAPIPASSGQTQRHRLNRQGDRQLNWALHVTAMWRMRSDERTRSYVERRRAEGKTDREIRRCLKRYIAREFFNLLEKPLEQSLDNL